MALEKRYSPEISEPELAKFWQEQRIYRFNPDSPAPVYSIDSPPATVSGNLHLGHVYSYSHPDCMARYFRMRGYQVFYPMGFDDNGLPTERLVEKRLGIKASQVERQEFIRCCLEISEEAEKEYRALWQRLGLSIDWTLTYRTIDANCRRLSQASFIDLVLKKLAYRRQAPTLWCPLCRTAIAQADLEDNQRETEFVTLPFKSPNGVILPIATTRPELLAACVAVFVHPDDLRYQSWIGTIVEVPFYGQQVPVMTDSAVDPSKGSGAVMCCTFGDQADVSWWLTYNLPFIQAIDQDGRMTPACGDLQGLTTIEARKAIKEKLKDMKLILERQPASQSIRVHERCDTPVETIITMQWFIRALDFREQLIEAGERIAWHPESMRARYRSWVENLSWDWCISRQRFYGVSFPVWYCDTCGEVMLADIDQLPVDPIVVTPPRTCTCGSDRFIPETDVMDTWATSSLTPQIITRWLADDSFFQRYFPMTVRPQAHEIIRTWAFYTILKSMHHFDKLPWSDILISGWGIAGEGMGKISKSRGSGGPMPPLEMIQRYSADAVRYWAASTSAGKDSIISEEKIQSGSRLVTKLWNVARFAQPFIHTDLRSEAYNSLKLTPADQWIIARTRRVIQHATESFENYEYAATKNEIENYFWRDVCDNYIEMAKQRMYNPASAAHLAACATLQAVILAVIKLFAPILPYITERIYQALYRSPADPLSIHLCRWPESDDFGWANIGSSAEINGEMLVAIATAVRRFKSERNLSLGTELLRLQLAESDSGRINFLRQAEEDLTSICRARQIIISAQLDPALIQLTDEPPIVAVEMMPFESNPM